jgi:hypothetical protein
VAAVTKIASGGGNHQHDGSSALPHGHGGGASSSASSSSQLSALSNVHYTATRLQASVDLQQGLLVKRCSLIASSINEGKALARLQVKEMEAAAEARLNQYIRSVGDLTAAAHL